MLRCVLLGDLQSLLIGNGIVFQLNWLTTVKEALNADETARDVQTAESLLKKHLELGDDIRAHDDE